MPLVGVRVTGPARPRSYAPPRRQGEAPLAAVTDIARRASNRRATARQHKDDVERRIVEYLTDHPQSTTGDIAKGSNANRATIAAGLSHIARASDATEGQAVK